MKSMINLSNKNIPEGWSLEILEKQATIVMGQSPESKFYNNNKGVPFLQGVRTFGDKYPFYDTYTNKVTKLAKKGSVLLSVRAPVGEVNIADRDVCIGRGLMSINSNNNTFLYYLLKAYKSCICEKETGTVYGSVTRTDIAELELPFPSKEGQEKIAEILSSLDDKIELNRKINKNLEKLAGTIFKKWFIDFDFPNENGEPYRSSGGKMIDSELGEIPYRWQIELLTDFVTIDKGLSYKGVDLGDEGKNLLIGLKCFERGGGFRIDGAKQFSGEFKSQHLLNPGDLIVAMTDLTQGAEVLGKPAIVPIINNAEHLIASLDVSILRPKNQQISKIYLYTLFMRQETQDYLFGYSNGSTVLHLSIKGLNEFKLVVGPDDILQKFNNIIELIFSQAQIFNSEIQNLQIIRDSLLSRLMSGKIRVKI